MGSGAARRSQPSAGPSACWDRSIDFMNVGDATAGTRCPPRLPGSRQVSTSASFPATSARYYLTRGWPLGPAPLQGLADRSWLSVRLKSYRHRLPQRCHLHAEKLKCRLNTSHVFRNSAPRSQTEKPAPVRDPETRAASRRAADVVIMTGYSSLESTGDIYLHFCGQPDLRGRRRRYQRDAIQRAIDDRRSSSSRTGGCRRPRR